MTASPNPGRCRTKFTPATGEQIIAAVRAGQPITTAARNNGIHPATLHRWAAHDKPETRAWRAALARARAEAAQDRVRREPITDDAGRQTGTRTIRHLRNGTTEITEDYQRPSRRAIRSYLRRVPDPLDVLLGLDVTG